MPHGADPANSAGSPAGSAAAVGTTPPVTASSPRAALPRGRLEMRQLLGWLRADGALSTEDAERLAKRFGQAGSSLHALQRLGGAGLKDARSGQALDADAALALGLVTAAPDDIDWDDEVRMALEERASMSPDALTGLEANLRFAQKENMAT
eukprot:gene60580-80791_t